MIEGVSTTQIVIAVLAVLVVMILFSFISRKSSGRGSKSSDGGGLFGGGAPARTALVLCGPCSSGKTTLFQTLIHPELSLRQTQTSMTVNSGWVAPIPKSLRIENDENSNPNPQNKRFEVIDCPGHMRLFDLTLDAFRSAKVICIVVDGTRVQDSQNGAGSIASLLMTILTAKETAGASVLIACNKRDEISSFTSKALQKYIEKELKHRLGGGTQNSSSSTSSNTAVDDHTNASGTGKLKKSEVLTLDENGQFDWDSAPRPVSFCDISAKVPKGKFVLDPLFEAM
jgi:signal recognition particle receptor subunit beta